MNELIMTSSSMGGGNNPNLNIIRHTSYQIYSNIILSETLNGTITPLHVWNRYGYPIVQNNSGSGYRLIFDSANGYLGTNNGYADKSATLVLNGAPTRMNIVIEFKE